MYVANMFLAHNTFNNLISDQEIGSICYCIVLIFLLKLLNWNTYRLT